jgi:hypothetical protein
MSGSFFKKRRILKIHFRVSNFLLLEFVLRKDTEGEKSETLKTEMLKSSGPALPPLRVRPFRRK